ncbi:hypothetical protein FSP39_007933 [Pinctada imbricata]|uniref:Uncharacterized protein n=1 Tax=Pinctada imbricata TaxID=66713 RepID=A0AA89C0U8_PINIB|nr:hypothetical protein FSP39_007933 [Pinctada imbricata]
MYLSNLSFFLPDNANTQKAKYTIKEFHNRSSLFPSTTRNKLYTPSSKNDSSTNEDSPNGLGLTCKKADVDVKKPNTLLKNNAKLPPSGQRSRPQSAKSRKDRSTSGSKCSSINTKDASRPGACNSGYSSNNTLSDFPSSKKTESCAWEDEQSYNDSDSGVRSCHSPSVMMLVPVGGKQVPVVDIGGDAPFPSYNFRERKAEKYVSQDVRGFVFTSPADVATNLRPFSAHVINNVGEKNQSINKKKRPSSAKSSRVKSDNVPQEITPSVFGMQNNRQVFGSIEDIGSTNSGTYPYKLSDCFPEDKRATDHSKNLKTEVPSGIEPLLPWRNLNLRTEDIGIDPSKCFVFLPSLDSEQYRELPIVPPPQAAGEELCYKEKLVPPPPPFRPIGAVRKEIEELENLLQGISTSGSNCGMVRYQEEIDQFRKTYKETMAKVPDRLLNTPEPVDTFGLRKFYTEHDEVMTEIRHRHTLCLMELAELEIDIGIESDRKYFKHQIYLPYEHDPD